MAALRQNVIIEGKPALTAWRAAQWLTHCLARRPAVVSLYPAGPEMLLEPHLRRYGSTSLFMKRLAYEPTLSFLADLVRPGDVVLDVGANFGVYSLVLSARAGTGGRCYAFEPGEDALLQLRRNLARNSRLPIEVVPVALSDREGAAPLFHTGGPTTFSLAGKGGEAEEGVSVTTLDAWARSNSIPSAAVMKVDVEGHETEVFLGGRDFLDAARPLIMFEISGSALARGGRGLSASFDALRAMGFAMHRYAAGQLSRVDAAEEGNLFAIHPESDGQLRVAHLISTARV